MRIGQSGRTVRGLTVLAVCVALMCEICQASNVKTWIGPAGGNWSNAVNWLDGGGPATTPPGSTDTAIFDGTSVNNCTVDGAFTCNFLTISAPYTGTVAQVAAGSLTVTTNVMIAGGTLDATNSTQATPASIGQQSRAGCPERRHAQCRIKSVYRRRPAKARHADYRRHLERAEYDEHHVPFFYSNVRRVQRLRRHHHLQLRFQHLGRDVLE